MAFLATLPFLPSKASLDPETWFNPRMKEWILPPWFAEQNNPLHQSYLAGERLFRNKTTRSWTILRGGAGQNQAWIDQVGVIHLQELGISVETWVYNGNCLYTPVNFDQVTQRFNLSSQGIETKSQFRTGFCVATVSPVSGQEIPLQLALSCCSEWALQPALLTLVVRPYNCNGFWGIRSLEYKDHYLIVNGRKILYFEREPQHSFFTNATTGDVTEYFAIGVGNNRISSTDGTSSGLLGYSGITAELTGVKVLILNATRNRLGLLGARFKDDRQIELGLIRRKVPNFLVTGTGWDNILQANFLYLETFSGDNPEQVGVFQVFVLNRFGYLAKSRSYLKKCLAKVSWDGRLPRQLLSVWRIAAAVNDYFEFSNDISFVKNAWPVLQRVGSWLGHFAKTSAAMLKGGNNEFKGEDLFWGCLSLKALAKMSKTFGPSSEAQLYREQYLDWRADLIKLMANQRFKVKNQEFSLQAAYFFQRLDEQPGWIVSAIELIEKQHLYRGGIFSPLDFQGIDLEKTARWGQVLLQNSREYETVIRALEEFASPSWNWPDRIHPATKKGIGITGHDPGVLYQVLLFLRRIFLDEAQEVLTILPGIFTSKYWGRPEIKLQKMPSAFGAIDLRCRWVGPVVQIDFYPCYHHVPQKVILRITKNYQLLYSDAAVTRSGELLEISPDTHILRFRQV